MRKTFEIIPYDISRGSRYSYQSCPVARAIKRSSNYDWVWVYNNYISCSLGFAFTTKKVRKFIKDFDNGKSVKPMKFTLNFKKILTLN